MGPTSDALLYTSVTIVSHKQCEINYAQTECITDHVICAAEKKTDACQVIH